MGSLSVASPTVRSAIWAKLTEVSTASGVKLIDTENTAPVVKNLPDQWFTVDYVPDTESRASIGTPGSTLYRETGEAEVSVVVKRNTGIGSALSLAEQIRNAFRGQTLTGVVIRTVEPPDLSDAFGDGNWTRASVPIAYEFDSIH